MPRKIPLPRGWNRRNKAAILQILALSHYAFTALLGRAANERNSSTAKVLRRLMLLLPLPVEVCPQLGHRTTSRTVGPSSGLAGRPISQAADRSARASIRGHASGWHSCSSPRELPR